MLGTVLSTEHIFFINPQRPVDVIINTPILQIKYV